MYIPRYDEKVPNCRHNFKYITKNYAVDPIRCNRELVLCNLKYSLTYVQNGGCDAMRIIENVVSRNECRGHEVGTHMEYILTMS